MAIGPAYDTPILQNIYRSLLYYFKTHTEKDEDGTAKTIETLIPRLRIVRPSQTDPSRIGSEATVAANEASLTFEHLDTALPREQKYGGSFVVPRLWMVNVYVGGGDASDSAAEKTRDAEEWLLRAFRHGSNVSIYSYAYGTSGTRTKSDDPIGYLRILNPRVAPQNYVTMAQGAQGWLQFTFEGSVRLFRPD